MKILSPSMLSADFCELGNQIKQVEEAGAEYLHVDVMDGLFVPSISYGMPVIKSIRKASNMTFDVHLMINEPIRYIDEFVESGADIITIHVEACADVKETIAKIHSKGVKAGITLNPATPLSAILPYLADVDMALVMSVNPGFGGQKFIAETLNKVRDLAAYKKEKNLNYDIEIDGGVNTDNLGTILEAGANVIVAGSAIFRGDIKENIDKFKAVMSVY